MRKYVKQVKRRNMTSKRTSKSAAKAIITCLIEENDSENADEYFESSDENSNEYQDVQVKFVDENTINKGGFREGRGRPPYFLQSLAFLQAL